MANHHRHSKGKRTKAVENPATKRPSYFFLWASLGALGALALRLLKRRNPGAVVGSWAARLFVVGIYKKVLSRFHSA